MNRTPSKRDRDDRTERRRSSFEAIESAQRDFDPQELALLDAKPYEKACAKAIRDGVAASDVKALSALEEEFKLHPHTLIKFLTWKKKQPQAIADVKSAAEKCAALRKKQKLADAAEEQRRAEEAARLKQAAADVILLRYKKNLNVMVAEAARTAVAIAAKDMVPIQNACKQVVATKDEHGNAAYHTLQDRTVLKHAERLIVNPSYDPFVKGGKPSVVNNPDGQEFIQFLKDMMFQRTRTGQNAMKFNDLNTWICDMYKLRYFKNQEHPAPEISRKTISKLRKLIKAKEHGAARYVSARRWEAMGDPRNYMSWYIAACLGLTNVPLELRFNWDDTSLFVAGEERGVGACVGVAFTAEEVAKELDLLNRSPGIQHPAQQKGKHCTPRMVQWGFLASGSARLEMCICKVYDRAIRPEDNLRLCFIKKQGDCDIYVLYIRGKQLAPGAVPTGAEAIAHGGASEHASEAQVAAVVWKEVADKIEKRKAEYAVAMRNIREKGFGGV
jgi:hypothetical protein